MKRSLMIPLTAAASILTAHEYALAGGLGLEAQSASGVSTAGASNTAGNLDISAIYSNIASIGAFKGQKVAAGLGALKPQGKYTDMARKRPFIGTDAPEETKTSGDDFFGNGTIVPALFGVHELNESTNLGWSVTVPLGTSTDYGKEWVGRYQGVKTKLAVLNIDLGASYKILDKVILGFGVQVQRGSGSISGMSNLGAGGAAAGIQAVGAAAAALAAGDNSLFGKLSQSQQALATQALQAAGAAKQKAVAEGKSAADADLAGQAALKGVLGQALASQVTANDGKADILAEYEGSDLAAGYTFGLLYDPMPDLTVGLSYRSAVKHKTKGDITFTSDTAVGNGYITAQQFDKDSSLDITTPASIRLGVSYRGVQDLTLFASAVQTQWTSLDALNIKYSGVEGDKGLLVKLNWKNTLASAVGASYKLNPELALRAGLGIDKTPTVDQYRNPRSPDADRTLISLGTGYTKDNWAVDFGFTHSIFKSTSLNMKENDYPEAIGRGDLEGDYKVSLNTLMLQYAQSL